MNEPQQSTVELSTSPAGIARLLLLGVLMTAASAWLVVLDGGVLVTATGWVGVVFFGGCGILWVERAVRLRGRVVTISPDGFRDLRVAREVVPWSDVLEISTWTHSGQQVMVLRVPDEVWDRLSLTVIARSSRRANRALGVDGLAISAQGLRATYPQMFEATVRAASAAWQAGHASGPRPGGS